MRFGCPVIAAVAALAVPALAQTTLDYPVGQDIGLGIVIGPFDNPGDAPAVVFADEIGFEDAAWLRLYFTGVQLPAGSFIRITSVEDREVQIIDDATAAMWSDSSAYFNGDRVTFELVAGPRSQGSAVTVDKAAAQFVQSGHIRVYCGICGADDRVPSDEDFAGRLMPVGCSATIYTTNSCLVSAGHCAGGSADIVEFRVPASSAGCDPRHPAVAEQFPIIGQKSQNGGVGKDWSVMTTGTNSLGQTAYERYGVLRPIAASPAVKDAAITVWGFGIDDQCTRSQIQQKSVGNVSRVLSTYYEMMIDITFGNSGSSVISAANEIVAIVTHCSDGCPDYGTRMDVGAFVTARAALCPAPTCAADCNEDGSLNINDFICMQSEWARKTSYGDYNKDGKWNINDFIAYQADFVKGCK